LLATGRNVAANAGEHLGAMEGAKAAGDFLPHFLHANIPLALVVGKGDLRSPQEGQDAEVVVFQTVEQIGRFALRALVSRMAAAALGENGVIASEDFLKGFLIRSPCELAALEALEQETAEFIGPGVLMFFPEEFQFTQVMLVAQRVQAVLISKVSLEMIVDDPVFAVRDDGQIIHGLGAPFGMDAIKGEVGVAHDVQPMELARHPQAAFIAMIDGCLRELGLDRFLIELEVGIGALVARRDGGLAQRLPVEVLTELGQTVVGDELLVAEIEQQGAKAGAILSGRVDARRKRGGDQVAGNGALFYFRLMLGHGQRLGRQFKDLALFIIEHRLLAQGAAWAFPARTAVQGVDDGMVGLGHLLE